MGLRNNVGDWDITAFAAGVRHCAVMTFVVATVLHLEE